ncbi:hypothetical protein HanRHA438_Chr09g0412921 [Helianthus annuus]|uniref:Uncharacterized protein n=1 Tax=Helianthus annuus TaxID=4232 RepID=A0A9K3I892_HELAN|nr:hypothetical protein HanXRQr2_Chr09g0401071 [Helianthus annuus]KAJ0535572.1 hypothetical protein HanIR_Chr09g0432071 [Helianthus annuus]KAJ0889443.1 hypothetical protein HanRHA438_Chr09g0412921 [Helianthus annuus]KAJ0894245.1 hypothetical protein HanPSC8_Chr09g0386881 [Helianthus annuus]
MSEGTELVEHDDLEGIEQDLLLLVLEPQLEGVEQCLREPILNHQLVLEPQLGSILKGARVPICTFRNQICFYFVGGSRGGGGCSGGFLDGGCNGRGGVILFEFEPNHHTNSLL